MWRRIRFQHLFHMDAVECPAPDFFAVVSRISQLLIEPDRHIPAVQHSFPASQFFRSFLSLCNDKAPQSLFPVLGKDDDPSEHHGGNRFLCLREFT